MACGLYFHSSFFCTKQSAAYKKMSSPILELIREKVNIADVVNSYVKDLRQAGRNYKACCPFHSEKTPSFTVSPDKGIFYCFGCHEGGDIFTFVMKMEGITFHEAAKKLALMAGVEYGDHSREYTKEEKERYAIKQALAFAKKFYCGLLFSSEGEKARLYIGSRKVNKAYAERFELGWAPPYGQSLLDAMKKAGYSLSIAEKAGLIKKTSDGRTRDVFRGRLMFPIKNQSGDTIAFGGRTLDPNFQPKYLNSPETPLFHKKKTLYGISRAMPEIRRTGRALVLEGYMDVIGAHQHGIGYAVAPLGTALSEEHAKTIGRAANDIILMFDDDAAGIKASVRAAEIFMEAGLFVHIASLKDGLDPDEYINKYGREAFEKIVDSAEDPLQFRIRQFFKNRPDPSAQEKAGAIRLLLKTVEKQPDEIVKSEWIKMIASAFNVESGSIIRQIEKNSAAKDSHPVKNSYLKAKEERKQNDNGGNEKISPLETDILQILINSPELISKYPSLSENDFSSQAAKKIFTAVKTLKERLNENNKKDTARMLMEMLPEAAQNIVAIAVSDISDKNAVAGFPGALSLLKKASAKRRMQELKSLPEMTPEQLQEYSLLAIELKSSGEQH